MTKQLLSGFLPFALIAVTVSHPPAVPGGSAEGRHLVVPPTITVTGGIGTNPTVIYTSGGDLKKVTISWNAGTEYPYCEIYYTVNGANQLELGREHDGTKSLIVAPGNTYELWMIVYLGAQGQEVRTVTELSLSVDRGSPPADPLPGGAIGAEPRAPADISESATTAGADRRAPPIRTIETNLHPFIKNVSVVPGSMDVVISFNSSQKSPPIIEIGKANPVVDRNGVLTFPYNSGAISRPVPGNNGAYRMHLSALNEQLDVGTRYFYIIKVFGDDPSLRHRQRDTYRGEFTTLRQTVTVFWEKVEIEDDSDDLSTGEVYFWFWSNFGDPSGKSSKVFIRDADSGETYGINKTNVIENAPNILVLEASGKDDDNTGTYLDLSGNEADPPITGAYSNKGWDMNAVRGEFNLNESSELAFSVPFRLSTSGGNLKFVVYGHYEVTRAEPGTIGTTSSALTAAPQPLTVRAQGRVRLPAGSPATPSLTTCEAARAARARNSPAAPGLEEKCRIEGEIKATARVTPPEGESAKAPKTICELAKQARARNSPAAPGLEAKCLAEQKR